MTPDLDILLAARDRKLSADEEFDIEHHRKGVELRGVVSTEAWEILTATLQQYADSATHGLLNLAPGDPNVPTAHAAAAALVDLSRKFKEDIEKAVSDSYEVPYAIREMHS